VIDYVVRNAEGFGHASGIVNIVERTAAALNGFRHAGVAGETALIPQLHGQSDDLMAFGT